MKWKDLSLKERKQMEILMPLGGAGFVGHELNKE